VSHVNRTTRFCTLSIGINSKLMLITCRKLAKLRYGRTHVKFSSGLIRA